MHKLFFNQPGRFSEELDFVQNEAKPIGETITSKQEPTAIFNRGNPLPLEPV